MESSLHLLLAEASWSSLGAVLPAVAICATLFVAIVQQANLFRWKQIDMSCDYVSQWDEKTSQHRKIIEAKYGCYWHDKPAISVSDPDAFAKAAIGEEAKIKESVIALMNWFDELAIRHQRRLLDRNIVDGALKEPVTQWYRKIMPLVDAINRFYGGTEGRRAWPAFDALYTEWTSKTPKPMVRPLRVFLWLFNA